MPDNYLELLGKYREKDEKTPQGEVIPEKETLNFTRMRDYMDKNGINYSTFDTLFKVKTAQEILRAGGTKGEQEMLRVISEGQNYLSKIGEPELIERENLQMFSSTAEKELRRRNELAKLPQLEESYRAYNTVRQLAKRQLRVQKEMGEWRESQKTSVEKGLMDTLGGVVEDVKKNFGKMSGGEKLLAVGGILAGAIMLIKSENGFVKKVKDYLFTAAKLAAGGVAANYVIKLFTGKSGVDTVSDWAKGSVSNDKFWTDTYKTDAEKGAILEKSVVYLGNKDFLDLARKYKDAKATGQTEIKVPGIMDKDMSPKEIYTALDVFFSRYPVQKLEQKYRNAKPAPFWSMVVGAEMTEDGRISMDGDLCERTATAVREVAIRGWNGFWVTEEGLGWMRALYLKARGVDPTEEQLQESVHKMSASLQNEVNNEGQLGTFFDTFMGINVNQPWVKNYKDLLAKGKWDTNQPQVKFLEVPGDSIYLMSESKFDATKSGPIAISEMLGKARGQAETFLKAKYPEAADNLYKFMNYEEMVGVRIVENSSYRLFMRMPLKGGSEYTRKSAMVEGGSTTQTGA
jgi:hypothetical protein